MALILALIARATAVTSPVGVSEITIGLLIGLLVANVMGVPDTFQPGVRTASVRVLRLGSVLLGAQLSIQEVLATGIGALAVVIVAAAVALGLTALLGRVMGLPPRLAVLIGIGTAICGNSAIAATAPVIDADETEVSFAVGTITVFGMAAFLLYPLIGHTLGMGEHLFGYWAGAAVNDTSQATATGFAFSQTAGGIATVVQLTRNTLLGPVLLVIGAMYARRTSRVPQPSSGRAPRLLTIVPAFVLGFVVLALVNSVGGIPLAAQSPIAFGAKLLILIALVGVGLQTNVREVRHVGLRPPYVGLASAVVMSLTAIALIALVIGIHP